MYRKRQKEEKEVRNDKKFESQPKTSGKQRRNQLNNSIIYF